MKTASLIRALEKEGFKVEVIARSRQIHKCTAEKYFVEWYDDAGEASCIYMCLNGLSDNLLTDYMPGFFCHKIKDVVKYLKIKRL